MTTMTGFVNVREAAQMLDLTDGRVRQLVGNFADGAIKAHKINERFWLIPISEIRKYAKKNGIELHDAEG